MKCPLSVGDEILPWIFLGLVKDWGKNRVERSHMDLCSISSNADFVPVCWGGAEPKGKDRDLHVDPHSDPHLWPLPVTERARSRTQAAKMSFLRWIPALSLWDRFRNMVIWDVLRFEGIGDQIRQTQTGLLRHLMSSEAYYWGYIGTSHRKMPQRRSRTHWKNCFSKMT